MNMLKVLGRFAVPGNVPVRLTPHEARDLFGRDGGTIYTFPNCLRPEPGFDSAAYVPAYGERYEWARMERWAQSVRGKPMWRGSDFYTAWEKIGRDARRWSAHHYGRWHYYKFVPADVIQMPSPVPVDPDQRYCLYKMTNGGFVFIELVGPPGAGQSGLLPRRSRAGR